jgi:hypothetical protein
MIDLGTLFGDHQLYHSEFQMDNLITIRAGGDTYGQYKQSLRELYKRYRGLKGLYSERDLLQVDIDELAEKLASDKFDERRNTINHRTKTLNMDEMNKNIEETEREFRRFYAQACALKSTIGELTPERRDELDRGMWEYKMKDMAAVDFLTTGRLGVNTIEFIGAVPIEMRGRILKQIRPDKQGELIEWFENKNDTSLQIPSTETDIKLLME